MWLQFIKKVSPKIIELILLMISALAILHFKAQTSSEGLFIKEYIHSDELNVRSKIAIIFRSGLGDKSSALTFAESAYQRGYDILVIGNVPDKRDISVIPNKKSFFRKIYACREHLESFQPSLILSFHDYVKTHPKTLSVLMLTNPEFFLNDACNYHIYPLLYQYDLLLVGASETYGRRIVADYPSMNGKVIQGFHTTNPIERDAFIDTKIQKIFFCGDLWDPLRKSPAYIHLYKQLDEKGLLSVYGPSATWQSYVHSYRGMAPFDERAFLGTIHQYQAALVLHSAMHYKNNIPSARIFECAAAKVPIICDRMPLIEQIFGDNILYISVSTDRNTLNDVFEQVYSHWQWIISHPVEAQQKSQNAYQIMMQKYSINQQWTKIEEMLEDSQTIHHIQ
ncbi:MAG: glycosyltransferase family 1 protein [Gammaproteobacteria bacterium]|nr:glycosyltransferase family 1 protein [Gammaproteobacteria bacterium]